MALNAAIALSILLLAPEIIRAWCGESSFTIRHPWAVAFAFGLLQGFGFAGVLSGAHLPRHELPLALVSFNLGVELGELAFVALALGLAHGVRMLAAHWPRWVRVVPGYAIGSVAAFWTVQRIALLVGGATR